MRSIVLMCHACKLKFPREEIVNNNGFCNNCITHTKLCDCGCGEVIFKYAWNNIRRYKDRAHSAHDTHKGIYPTLESRTKMSESQRKRFEDENERIKISVASKLMHENPETSAKLSASLYRYYETHDGPNKGISFSEESRNKMSESQKLRFSDNDVRLAMSEAGKNYYRNNPYSHPMLGRNQSEHSRRLMSINRKGEKNGRWNGGKSFEVYPEEFSKELKDSIRARQNYECADNCISDCSNDITSLNVHHIDQDKRNNSTDNLIALCRSHHSMAHNEEARLRHNSYNTKFN